jgi:asparagine synthase (glutamine-hydrolysing)
LIFSGWGGDQFISSAYSGIDYDFLVGLKWGLFFKKNPVYKPKSLLKTVLFSVVFPAFCIINWTAKKELKKRNYYLKKIFKKSNTAAIKNFFFYTSRRIWHLKMLKGYSISERCEKWYIQGFRNGIEYRYPLLDKRIIEYILKIPSENFIKGKYPRTIMLEITKDLLPENVRSKNSKMDHALHDSHIKMKEKLTPLFAEEINEWKNNPDLKFINFQLLEKDVKKIQENPEHKDYFYLHRSLYFFKGLHEFTKTYRSLPNQAESGQFSVDQV